MSKPGSPEKEEFGEIPQNTYGSLNDSRLQGNGADILNMGIKDVVVGYVKISVKEQLTSMETWRSVVGEFLGSFTIAVFFALTVYALTPEISTGLWNYQVSQSVHWGLCD